MNQREEWHFLAGFWETVAEDAEGWALEQAIQNRNHFLRLLGMIALDGKE